MDRSFSRTYISRSAKTTLVTTLTTLPTMAGDHKFELAVTTTKVTKWIFKVWSDKRVTSDSLTGTKMLCTWMLGVHTRATTGGTTKMTTGVRGRRTRTGNSSCIPLVPKCTSTRYVAGALSVSVKVGITGLMRPVVIVRTREQVGVVDAREVILE